MAGNAQDEADRWRILRQLEVLSELGPSLRSAPAQLLPVAEDWANGKSRVVVDKS